jgi:hypothetical protein
VIVAISSGTAEAALRFPDGPSKILLEGVKGTFVVSVGVNRGFTIWGVQGCRQPRPGIQPSRAVLRSGGEVSSLLEEHQA